MEYEIFEKDKRVCVKPLRSTLEAFQKLQSPTTVKGCKSFVGMVNFPEYVLPRMAKMIKTHI